MHANRLFSNTNNVPSSSEKLTLYNEVLYNNH